MEVDLRRRRKIIENFTIAALNTGIISLKELLTEKSNTMASLKTQVDIINTKGGNGDKTATFSNPTNIELKHPT